MQLQLFEGLNGCVEGLDSCVEAYGAKKLDGGGSPCQLSLCGDEEIQALEAHVRARDPADAVASHMWTVVDNKTRKRPLPGAPTVGVSSRRLVNLYLRVLAGWCARSTQGFILVRAECPYVQFKAARVTNTCL